MTTKYAIIGIKENMAKAKGTGLPISTKQSIEICDNIRYLTTDKAKMKLARTIEMKSPIRFKRFTNGLGHKPGMAAGRYPIKACREILKLLKAAEANAQNKGLGSTKIMHICANKASSPMKYGRQSRRHMKRTHVEIVLVETEAKKPAAKDHRKEQKETEPKEDKK